MGIWEKVKNNGLKVKLQGETAMLQRDVTTRQKAFGVELYDLLTNDKNKLLGVSAGGILSKADDLKEPLERAREDINAIQAKKDLKQTELDVLEVKGAHTLPDTTLGQRANKAGTALANGAKSTKLQAEMAYFDREIKLRKEQFGVQVFGVTQNSEQRKEQSKSNPVKRLSNAMMSNLSQHEQDLQACIDKAKEDVARLEGKIRSKQMEIHSLNDGETEPMVSSSN